VTARVYWSVVSGKQGWWTVLNTVTTTTTTTTITTITIIIITIIVIIINNNNNKILLVYYGDGGRKFLRNNCKYASVFVASYPTKLKSLVNTPVACQKIPYCTTCNNQQMSQHILCYTIYLLARKAKYDRRSFKCVNLSWSATYELVLCWKLLINIQIYRYKCHAGFYNFSGINRTGCWGEKFYVQ
jgi:hypothetical protein